MTTRIILRGDMQKNTAIEAIKASAIDLNAPLEVLIRPAKKNRSLEQNAISHAWYEELSKKLPEENVLGWKCFCKLHFGVPILRAEDPEFREVYDNTIKLMTYEQKLEVMKFFPISSIMSTNQLSRYLEAMQKHFIEQHQIRLEFPVHEDERMFA
jgi:hypothetical protein